MDHEISCIDERAVDFWSLDKNQRHILWVILQL